MARQRDPRAEGVPERQGRQQGLFHWRTFLGRSVGICLVITATMPFGREGPSVHIGACAASVALNLPWRTYLGWQPSPEERRQILQLGSAAESPAAFNAPIGGLLYVMESPRAFSDYVWQAVHDRRPPWASRWSCAPPTREPSITRPWSSATPTDPAPAAVADLPLVAVLAALAGALSAAYTVAADFFGKWRRRPGAWTPQWLANAMGTRWGCGSTP